MTHFSHPKLESMAGFQIRKAASISNTIVSQALSSEDFRLSEAAVLYKIAENPGITASEIGRSLNMKRSNITPIVSRFNQLGLLKSEEIDGRSTALRISEAGEAKFEKIRAIIENHDKIYFSTLSESELLQFKTMLNKIGVCELGN